MAELEFTPTFAVEAITEPQAVEFTRAFLTPRGNFSFGLGLGIGIEIREKPNAGNAPIDSSIAIHVLNLDLEFVGKERNPDITV